MNRLQPAFAAAVLSCVVVLAGCVSAPSVDLQPSSAATIRRIAILKTPNPVPARVLVMNIGGPAMAFGAIGGLAQGLTNADHSKQFAAVLASRDDLAALLTAQVERALRAEGYQVVEAFEQHPKLAADGKSDDYADVHVDADAILSLWYNAVGYVSGGYSLHYEPTVLVKVRLVDAKTKKDLYAKTLCVGYKWKIENAVLLPADPGFLFKSFDDLVARPDAAATGVRKGVDSVATRVGWDLRPSEPRGQSQ